MLFTFFHTDISKLSSGQPIRPANVCSTGHQGMHGHEFLEFELSHGQSAFLIVVKVAAEEV